MDYFLLAKLWSLAEMRLNTHYRKRLPVKCAALAHFIQDVARKFAREYQDHVGAQVRQLLEYLDSSEDLETFQRHLGEILATPPSSQQVETIKRGGVVARLMGRLRNEG